MGGWRCCGAWWVAVLFSLAYTGPARDFLSPTGAAAYVPLVIVFINYDDDGPRSCFDI